MCMQLSGQHPRVKEHKGGPQACSLVEPEKKKRAHKPNWTQEVKIAKITSSNMETL